MISIFRRIMVYLYKDVKDLIMGFAGVKEIKLCDDVTITKYKCDICRRWLIYGYMQKRDYYTVEDDIKVYNENEFTNYKIFRRRNRIHLCWRTKCMKYHSRKGWSIKTTDI